MTCFWDGLMKGLNNNDFQKLGETKTNIHNLIKLLQQLNIETKNVYWNNKQLKKKELIENFKAVQNYNINSIHNGYLCSSCDFTLLLICELFNINIEHKYLQNIMYYTKPDNQHTLIVQSDKGHFWFKNRH